MTEVNAALEVRCLLRTRGTAGDVSTAEIEMEIETGTVVVNTNTTETEIESRNTDPNDGLLRTPIHGPGHDRDLDQARKQHLHAAAMVNAIKPHHQLDPDQLEIKPIHRIRSNRIQTASFPTIARTRYNPHIRARSNRTPARPARKCSSTKKLNLSQHQTERDQWQKEMTVKRNPA